MWWGVVLQPIKYLYVEEVYVLTSIFSNAREWVGDENNKYP